MKRIVFVFSILVFVACKKKVENELVEVSCGQCQFGLTSQQGCDLAVRIDNKAYFVDGAHIDDFGDAHDKQKGFCEVIRKGKVTGAIENNRFNVKSLTLIE